VVRPSIECFKRMVAWIEERASALGLVNLMETYQQEQQRMPLSSRRGYKYRTESLCRKEKVGSMRSRPPYDRIGVSGSSN
jgi:hypothetical protein